MRDNIWKFYMIFFKKKIENKDKRQNWKYFKEFRNKEWDFEKMGVEGWEQKRLGNESLGLEVKRFKFNLFWSESALKKQREHKKMFPK